MIFGHDVFDALKSCVYHKKYIPSKFSEKKLSQKK